MEKKVIKKVGIMIFAYSLLIFTGGFIGFAIKQSIPSLVAGSLFGLFLLFLSIKTMTYHRWGLIAALVLILVLDTFFSYRFLVTQKFFPSGAMLVLTTLVILVQIFQLRKLKNLAKSQ